ncbi:c-type cytochrome [Aestuariivirga sp.]|uniref:c-type cytochrome n=1 Tax=Aestuariivirga sp. TaxID=2650926 RepID=UPI003784E73F
MKTSMFALLALLALAPVTQAQASGDAAKGEKVFAKCKACHVVDAETNKVGPHLKGVIGRNVAAVEGYKYSAAMLEFATANPQWTEELFVKYIENPKAMVPKTKMVFPGLKKEEDRADLLAFLKTKM